MTARSLHSTKYDGSLHYRFELREVRCGERELVTYHWPGTTVESYRGTLPGAMQMLSFFWPDRYFNLHVCWHADWRPRSLYVNIATPATWDGGVVRYVDLDLDLILRPNAAALHLDDADEFETHRVRWSYPAELVERCHGAVEEVRGLFAAKIWPFDPALFEWRPGQAAAPHPLQPPGDSGR